MSRSGIVNVRMVITEEKILSNIAKVQRLIDPNSKKQIVQLEDDAFFKDLVESIKTYLIEYPKKKNFPKSVYKAAYGLVEFATNEFEENTKQIEELIRQREKNIALSGELKDVLNMVVNKEDGWKESIKEMSDDFTEDILDTLGVIGRSKSDKSQNYQDALKLIPAPQEDAEEVVEEKIETVEQPKAQILQQAQPVEQDTQYYESTRVEVKPSLWQRFKQSKFVRTIKYIMKIKVVLDIPALPSADEDRR